MSRPSPPIQQYLQATGDKRASERTLKRISETAYNAQIPPYAAYLLECRAQEIGSGNTWLDVRLRAKIWLDYGMAALVSATHLFFCCADKRPACGKWFDAQGRRD
jgi:hypothetical protein